LAASGDGEIPRNFSQSEELFVPEFLPELRRNTVCQLTDNGFLCDITGHIGLFRPEKFIDIHYGTHGIQEVSGSIPLISTKSREIYSISRLFLYFLRKKLLWSCSRRIQARLLDLLYFT